MALGGSVTPGKSLSLPGPWFTHLQDKKFRPETPLGWDLWLTLSADLDPHLTGIFGKEPQFCVRNLSFPSEKSVWPRVGQGPRHERHCGYFKEDTCLGLPKPPPLCPTVRNASGWLQVSGAKSRDMRVREQTGHGLQQQDRGARASQKPHSPPQMTPRTTQTVVTARKGSRQCVAELGFTCRAPFLKAPHQNTPCPSQ